MKLSYNGQEFEASPQFIQAVKDFMKAEIEMMREVDDNPLNWAVGVALVDDLGGGDHLRVIYGSAQDFAGQRVGPREIVYEHPREDAEIKFAGDAALPKTHHSPDWATLGQGGAGFEGGMTEVPQQKLHFFSCLQPTKAMTAGAIVGLCEGGFSFYQVTQMNIIECQPIQFTNAAGRAGQCMWLADNSVGRLGNTVAPNTYFATREAAVTQLRKNIIGFVEALNEGVLKDNPAELPVIVIPLTEIPEGWTPEKCFRIVGATGILPLVNTKKS